MPAVCHRFFFGLQPPKQECALMGVHRDAIENAHGHVANDRFHLTLSITEDFDDYPRNLEQMLLAIGYETAAAPFAVSLDRLSGGSRSIALRPSRQIRNLSDLHRKLDHRLTRRHIRRRDWSFSPHATLAYRTGTPFQQPVAPIVWNATDFVLIHSIVGATQHIELGRWPLIDRQLVFDF